MRIPTVEFGAVEIEPDSPKPSPKGLFKGFRRPADLWVRER
jgi:hypothetical protein